MTIQLPCVRAAIAMNNVGCSLLERSCYDQAHQTLKDAAHSMVMLLNGDSDDTRRSVAAKLFAANQRLAFPQDAAPALVDDGGKFPAPLRLDVDALDLQESSSDLLVLSAISVHNSAVSCFFQSLDACNSFEKRRGLTSKAVVLLQSSYTLIKGANSFTPSTLVHALHILENLSRILRLSKSSSVQEDQGPAEDEGLAESALPGSFALNAELAQLRSMVQALDSADANIFGCSVFAAAA